MKRFSIDYNHKLKHATTKLRTQADLFDLVAITFFSHFLMASFTGFMRLSVYRLNVFSSAKLLARTLDLYPLIFLTCFFGYFLVSLYLTNGRTISYLVFNLYAVPKAQRDLDFKTCFLRASAYTIPIGMFGINPILGIASYYLIYKPMRVFGMHSPLIDVISDCHVFELKDEDVDTIIQEEVRSTTVLISESSSHVIQLPHRDAHSNIQVETQHQMAEVIEFPTPHPHPESEDEAA